MKINVSQKDIDKGIGGDGNECPIALAVRRAFKTDDVLVSVDCEEDEDTEYMFFRINTKDYYEKYIDKYEHILNFIHWFDNGLTGHDGCEPFKFNIDTHA